MRLEDDYKRPDETPEQRKKERGEDKKVKKSEGFIALEDHT